MRGFGHGALAVVVAVLVAAPAGCGEGPEQDVESAFADLRAAYLAEDYAAVCRGLSKAAQREVGELGHGTPRHCPDDMEARMSAAIVSPRDRADPEIRSVSIDGDRATVVALLGGDTPGDVHFVRQDEEWKLDQLFGTTAPPPPDLR